MLARLDRMPGIAESRVDWQGEHVLIRLAPGAAAEDVVSRAAPILGEGARRLDAATEAERVASFRKGEPWMNTEETIRLSRHEADVLAERHARDASKRAGLNEDQGRKLEAALNEEINALFGRIHASGTEPRDTKKEDLKSAERRLRARCLTFASAAQVDAIVEVLKSALGLCPD